MSRQALIVRTCLISTSHITLPTAPLPRHLIALLLYRHWTYIFPYRINRTSQSFLIAASKSATKKEFIRLMTKILIIALRVSTQYLKPKAKKLLMSIRVLIKLLQVLLELK